MLKKSKSRNQYEKILQEIILLAMFLYPHSHCYYQYHFVDNKFLYLQNECKVSVCYYFFLPISLAAGVAGYRETIEK